MHREVFHDHVFVQPCRHAPKLAGTKPLHFLGRPSTVRRASCRRRSGHRRHFGTVRLDRLDSAGHRRAHRPERRAVIGEYESCRPAVLRAAFSIPYVRGAVLLIGVHVCVRHGGRALSQAQPRADSAAGYPAVSADSGLSFRHHHYLDGAVPRFDAGCGSRVDFRHLHQSGMEYGVLVHPIPDQRAARTR